MRTPVTCILPLAALCCLAVPSVRSQAPQHPKLADGFAMDALRTVKMIEAEAGGQQLGPDGSVTVPAITNQAVTDLDVAAVSKSELAVVAMTRSFFSAKVAHNTQRRTLFILARTALLEADLPSGPLQAADLLDKSPTVAAITQREDACSQSLEAMLRGRVYADVPACRAEALKIVAPDKFDVRVK